MVRSTYWVGIDVGADRTSLCVVDECGEIVREGSCASKPSDIIAFLETTPRDEVARLVLEAGCGTYLSRKLRDHGYPVTVLESRRTKRLLSIRRNKTDINDARGLADIARLTRSTLPEVHLKSLECQHLRTRLRLREKLVRHRVAAEGFVRSLIRLHGCRLPSIAGKADTRSRVEAEMERLWLTDGVELFEEINPLLSMAEALRDHLKCSDAWLLKAARAHPLCKRFLEIPGVGPVCALSFYSAVEEPFRFERSSDVAAYLGLTPRVHQSGNTRRTSRITKMGNALTRTHLVLAANCLLRAERQPTRLREWGVELAGRIGGRKARVAVARKLAVVMVAMWKNDTRFDPSGGSP